MTLEEVFQVVKKNIYDILPFLAGKEIVIESSLKDLGANSIDRMEIVTLSMESLNVKIPPNEFADVNDIKGLVNLLQEKVNG
ncbi:MAG: acyl carrier protein [Candidatus Scalindua sp.]|jgi:polyketide biosynthesis acyl carrier protein|nr:acyl carrier protein [Candidatus Scalindua sp.]MBT5307581.1 acyl carrier protein [Candidatus Scalindua sp.]MBT6228507.1 acyl carrier protein [Candidatus Scalindua sp.]MBT6564854.1 acyl carrier protein [Candidatus Scalindua sp.]MBT7211946.1 acyl carrier protein [Candidatus Scalindua sp.]